MEKNNHKALVLNVQNANTFANTLFAFVFIFTTASTSSSVRLIPLSCDFFNQLSIEQNLTSSSSMVVTRLLNYI